MNIKKIFCLLLLIAVYRVGAWAQVEYDYLSNSEMKKLNVHSQNYGMPHRYIASSFGTASFASKHMMERRWPVGLTLGWYIGNKGYRSDIDINALFIGFDDDVLFTFSWLASFDLPLRFLNSKKWIFTPSIGVGVLYPVPILPLPFFPIIPAKCQLSYCITNVFSIGAQVSYDLLRIVNAPGLFSAGIVLGFRL